MNIPDISGLTADELNTMIQAHRYLYHVQKSPVISDQSYDMLKTQTADLLAEDAAARRPSSPHEQGYTAGEKEAAYLLTKSPPMGM